MRRLDEAEVYRAAENFQDGETRQREEEGKERTEGGGRGAEEEEGRPGSNGGRKRIPPSPQCWKISQLMDERGSTRRGERGKVVKRSRAEVSKVWKKEEEDWKQTDQRGGAAAGGFPYRGAE